MSIQAISCWSKSRFMLKDLLLPFHISSYQNLIFEMYFYLTGQTEV